MTGDEYLDEMLRLYDALRAQYHDAETTATFEDWVELQAVRGADKYRHTTVKEPKMRDKTQPEKDLFFTRYRGWRKHVP